MDTAFQEAEVEEGGKSSTDMVQRKQCRRAGIPDIIFQEDRPGLQKIYLLVNSDTFVDTGLTKVQTKVNQSKIQDPVV